MSLLCHNVVRVSAIRIACLVLGAVTATVVSAEANGKAKKFTNKTVAGTWGYTMVGPVILAPPANPVVPAPSVPVSAVGVISFDGNGGCSSSRLVNLNGTGFGPIVTQLCTYSVNPDGSGLADLDFLFLGANTSIQLAFVIVDNTNEIRFIGTDEIMSAGVAKRQ